jgi:hypothetical protein
MSALKMELIDFISDMTDETLIALKPLLIMLSDRSWKIQRVRYEDLTDNEKASVDQANREYENGETIKHEDIDWN